MRKGSGKKEVKKQKQEQKAKEERRRGTEKMNY